MGRSLKKSISISTLASAIGLEYLGSVDEVIFRIDSALEAQQGSLCFAKNPLWSSKVNKNAIQITSEQCLDSVRSNILISKNPRLDFARALTFLEKFVGFEWSRAPCQIDKTAKIGQNVMIGYGVRIGANTIINHNVVICDEVQIGERCVIKSGAVIGEDGFGFEKGPDGIAIRLPHIGSVVIQDDVEVGSLTTVCRGTIDNTILHSGSKIDDHVHISHNVIVGRDAFVIACAEISGGVKIGAGAWIAPNASVLNQISIGENAVVGLGAVVVKNVQENTIVAGNPAKLIAGKES